MADLTGTTSRTGHHFAVRNDSATHSGTDRDIDEVFGADVIAKASFCEGCESGVVSNPHRDAERFSQ